MLCRHAVSHVQPDDWLPVQPEHWLSAEDWLGVQPEDYWLGVQPEDWLVVRLASEKIWLAIGKPVKCRGVYRSLSTHLQLATVAMETMGIH